MDNSIEAACTERWCALVSTVNLIRHKKEAGMATLTETIRARELLFELRLYHDAQLMPDKIRALYESKIDAKMKRLLQ